MRSGNALLTVQGNPVVSRSVQVNQDNDAQQGIVDGTPHSGGKTGRNPVVPNHLHLFARIGRVCRTQRILIQIVTSEPFIPRHERVGANAALSGGLDLAVTYSFQILPQGFFALLQVDDIVNLETFLISKIFGRVIAIVGDASFVVDEIGVVDCDHIDIFV